MAKSRAINGTTSTLRFTYLMPSTIERNLAFFAFKEGITKQDAITQAIEKLLKEAGLDPSRTPQVSVCYPPEN